MNGTTLIDDVREKGYCLIENVVPEDCCAEIRQRLLKVVEHQRSSIAPERVGFVPSVINHDQSFAPYLADLRLMQVATSLLGHGLRISFTSVIVNEPGNARGGWHADWPFNQNNAGHIAPPYPDAIFHLTTLWMISPFNAENGGTLVVPGSHRRLTNPTHSDHDVEVGETIPTEINVAGPIGSVLLFDSRLWHSTSPNQTDDSRVALAVRYAPWWLNLEVLRPESDERQWLCSQTGNNENLVPSIEPDVYEQLPANVQPLYRHWLARADARPALVNSVEE
ncbi:MAG: phytanoyl-CoA dioxygenase family protein [Pirellulales bacterium]